MCEEQLAHLDLYSVLALNRQEMVKIRDEKTHVVSGDQIHTILFVVVIKLDIGDHAPITVSLGVADKLELAGLGNSHGILEFWEAASEVLPIGDRVAVPDLLERIGGEIEYFHAFRNSLAEADCLHKVSFIFTE